MKIDLSDIAAIVLAGGDSNRLQQPKQLIKYKDKTLIEVTLDALNNSGVKRRLVVTGSHHQSIAEVISGERWTINHTNSNTGIGSSISLGIKTLINAGAPPKAILILLSDQPFLTATHIEALISCLNSSSKNVDAIATIYDSHAKPKYGVPTLFSQPMYESLKTLSGDNGAQKILNSKEFSVIGVTPDFDTKDIDRSEDLDSIHR